MLNLDQVVEVKIERLAFGGDGVAHHQGLTLFVPRAAPNDLVKVKVSRLFKRYVYADIVEIINPSNLRTKPPCENHFECGSCHYQHINQHFISKLKFDQVSECLERIGKIKDAKFLSPFVPKHLFEYRNKVVYHRKGRKMGYIDRDGKHVLDIHQCMIVDPTIDRLYKAVYSLLINHDSDIIPYISIRKTTHNLILILSITDQEPIEQIKNIGLNLKNEFEQLTVLVTLLEKDNHFSPYSDNYQVLLGDDQFTHTIDSIHYHLNFNSFFQIHDEGALALLKTVQETFFETNTQVLDVFCGVGFFSLGLASKNISTYGVELDHQAIEKAKQSASNNNLSHLAKFRAGKAATILPKLLQEGLSFSHALIDPPRKGLIKEEMNALLMHPIKRLMYVSCSPPSMARDLKILLENGYRLQWIKAFDNFPQTYHIECIAYLEK